MSLERVVRLHRHGTTSLTRGLPVIVLASSLFLLLVQLPAHAHSDPETGTSISGASNDWYETPVPLDGKTFANPSLRVILQDNSPDSYWYYGGTTSTSAYLEMDLALTPPGYCPSNPWGPIDIQIRDLAADRTPLTSWRTTNSFDKQAICSRASRFETWHFGRDSIGAVTQGGRDFQVRLVDRYTSSVYLNAIGPGAFVTPRAPTGFTVTSTSATRVSLQWYDNSRWENHMELQRAGEPGTSWSTVARVKKTDGSRGFVYYNDYVPFSPSTMYRYRVRAVAGDQASAWSPVVATSVPTPPLGFSATPQARSVALQWQDVYGEEHYEIERSKDAFQTVQTMWNVARNETALIDTTTEGIETYQYRIRAVNEGGASSWTAIEVRTPGLIEPLIPEFYDAVNAGCADTTTTWPAMSCIYGEMYEFQMQTAEVEICTRVDGVPANCEKYLLTGPANPPSLPDDDDPSVPPTRLPDGSEWKPPHAPGEPEWTWGSDLDIFPTREGSWWRRCLEGSQLKEYLHWDHPHPPGKPSHWGFKDCLGKGWEVPFEWVQYGKAWYPEGETWW